MSTAKIHPTSIVSSDVILGKNISIGPFCIIEEGVEIGDNTKIISNTIIRSGVNIGKNNTFFQFCSIGEVPQDLGYDQTPTKVEIGDNNIFREYVSVHKATTKENHITKIGSNSLFMAYVHVGHDVIVGDNCIIVNSVNLAGHVKLSDRVIIGGASNVSQFVSLGRGAYIGGASAVTKDIPAFCTAYGNRVSLRGVNIIGLRRLGYPRNTISEVVDFYRSMEASALSPRAFINHDELMVDFNNNEIISEMTKIINESEVGIAPFTV